jgi:8-oxo-dGTP diphosphatase
MNIKSPKFLVVVRSIILDNHQRVLLLKRSKESFYYPGMWEIPGGKVEAGEDLERSLERLTDKESKIVTEPLSNKYYCQSRYVNEEGKYQGYNYIEIARPAKYISGQVKISEGHEDYKWIHIKSALEEELTLETKKSLQELYKDISEREVKTGTEVPFLLAGRVLIKKSEKDNLYLFIKRSSEQVYANKWELPGGKLRTLESLDEHLKREVLEETGINVSIINNHLAVYSRVSDEGLFKGFTYVNIVASGIYESGNVKLGPDHNGFKWLSIEEIKNLDLAFYMIPAINQIFFKKE